MGLLSNKNSKKSLSNTCSSAQSLSTDNDSTSTYSTSCLSNVSSTATNTASSTFANSSYIFAKPSNTVYSRFDTYALEDMGNIISTYLTEDEISDIYKKISSRSAASADSFIKSVVQQRHFSEGFLMQYISALDESSILCHHRSDILSGQYSQLALIFTLR